MYVWDERLLSNRCNEKQMQFNRERFDFPHNHHYVLKINILQLSNSIIVLPKSLVVSVEINRRHYFGSVSSKFIYSNHCTRSKLIWTYTIVILFINDNRVIVAEVWILDEGTYVYLLLLFLGKPCKKVCLHYSIYRCLGRISYYWHAIMFNGKQSWCLNIWKCHSPIVTWYD